MVAKQMHKAEDAQLGAQMGTRRSKKTEARALSLRPRLVVLSELCKASPNSLLIQFLQLGSLLC